MKKIFYSLAALSALFNFGCFSAQSEPPLNESAATTAAIREIAVTGEHNAKLRTHFTVNGSETAFCVKLAERLSSGLLPEYVEGVSTSSSDVQIMLQAKFEQLDVSGGYYRIRCNQVTLGILFGGKLRSTKVIEPKELPRKLGVQTAKDQYLAPVVKAAAPYLQKELKRLIDQEIGVREVSFRLAGTKNKTDAKQIAGQIGKINLLLSRHKGIVNYALVSQNDAEMVCTFRIVYFKRQFPQGLSNYLNHNL